MMGIWLVASCIAALTCNLLFFGTLPVRAGEEGSSEQLLESDEQGALEVSVDEAAEGVVDGRFDVILDVRQPEEYEDMHISGAVLMPLNTLREEAKTKLGDPNVSILTYCAIGGRSLEATKILRDIGFADVVSLRGGIIAWKEKGHPVSD
ncbi:MAG: rhodanese-like domain-containing protein [Candidatus Brocadiales bacterium]